MSRSHDRHDTDGHLAGHLESLRRVEADRPAETLGADARRAVLTRARARRGFPELAPLFTPLTHWAYIAGMPAAALALIFALTGLDRPVQQVIADGSLGADSGVSVRVYKVNGQVVFEGDGVSRVHRSDNPLDFSAATPLDGTAGRFVDPQNGSSGVVYYRIE